MSGDLLVSFVKGFCALEALDKLKALGAYSDEPLEKQQQLLFDAVIGHVQKALSHISELKGVGISEAVVILQSLAPGIAEYSDRSVFDERGKIPTP